MVRIMPLALAALFLVPASVRAQDEGWQTLLKAQLFTEMQCSVAFFSNTEEYELGGRAMLKTRAHCEDGRAYDASRTGDDPVFTILECGVQVCAIEPPAPKTGG